MLTPEQVSPGKGSQYRLRFRGRRWRGPGKEHQGGRCPLLRTSVKDRLPSVESGAEELISEGFKIIFMALQ
ncbi:hypothetical protein NDU88_000189 [Pleurodeles waltl]|uniref:Uncharacterized protein n=1 Tax=Pleurodeles waltl TaxID=8319 RepID=A0AAV7P4B1_PLEWA|nr:hypothetical protein NDU88_000189 [Pleurodeles waltl]